MSIIDNIRNVFTPAPVATPQTKPTPADFSARHLAGQRARISVDNPQDLPFFASMFIAPPPDADSSWRTSLLDDQTLDRISPADLVELLVNISPEVSRAVEDYNRMFNPGWEVEVYRLNSDTTIDKRGQAYIDGFIDRLGVLYGAFDVVLSRLILGGFLRGAYLAEVVLDDQGRESIDLATPDPYSVRFRKVRDPLRGNVWEMVQWQAGKLVKLDTPTISYIPLDPLPGSPYGRSKVAPAIFPALFLMGFLHDLRRVISQQGYPRLDISLDLEKLAASMPGDILSDPTKFREWVNQIVSEIKTVYESLKPEDAYVHTSPITVNRPVGTVNADSLGAVDGIVRMLERMLARALKATGFMMIISESATETQSIRQMKAYIQGIKSAQHLLEQMLERLFKVALQAQGLQCDVEFRFAELESISAMTDAQTQTIEWGNLVTAEDRGWITQDEAAQAAVGHPAVGPARAVPTPPQPDQVPVDATASRAALLAEVRAARLDVARAIEIEEMRRVGVSRNGHKVEA